MGKSQRDKGYRTENNLRNLFIDSDIQCRRVPLSGGADGYKGDLIITVDEQEHKAEVKCRGNGFKSLYEWLSDNEYLFVKADRRPYLCVMTVDNFIEMCKTSVHGLN